MADINRRSFVKATGAGAVGAAFAGCLGDDDEDALTVGYPAPVELDMGVGGQRTAEMYIDQINENGGIMDREVELVVEDTGGAPGEADSVTRQMLQDGVDVIIGGFASEESLAIQRRVAGEDVPFFVLGSAAMDLSERVQQEYDEHKNTFMMATNSQDFTVNMADFAVSLSDQHGWNTFAIIAEDAAWNVRWSEIVPDELDERGLDVVMNDRIALDTTDWSPILDEIEAEGADTMFKAIAQMTGVSLINTWAEAQYPFGQDGSSVFSTSSRYWEQTNGNCLYETATTAMTAGNCILTDKTAEVVEDYEANFGDEGHPDKPMYIGLTFVDALDIYADAVESVGSTEDIDNIVDEIEGMDHEGSSGRFDFYPPDDERAHFVNREVPVVVPQWQEEDGEGDLVCVYPDDVAGHDHIAPDWV